MGYTHYFSTLRQLTAEEWSRLSADVRTILETVEHRCEVRLANGAGDRGSKPEFTDSHIAFNGSGDDAHETFTISGAPERDFCKTARKPYDVAAAAVLCYLSCFHELGEETTPRAFHVQSDGKGSDFALGLEAAKVALPALGNVLDIPMGVMESDRWCGPWVDGTERYDFRFCVDGFAYVMDSKTGKAFRFRSHRAAAEWASQFTEKPIIVESSWAGRSREGGKSLFSPSGCFNEKRNQALRRQRDAAFRPLFDAERGEAVTAFGELGPKPPAFVRPDTMLPPAEKPNAYYLTDLLAEA